MGRRSDHSRAELAELILGEAHALMAEVGFARFSAREVAKRIGYSIGTVYNVFGSLDRLLLAVNSRTFLAWAAVIRERLDSSGDDRIAALVEGYFDFAEANPRLWMAIYDHRLPPDAPFPEDYFRQRAELTGLVEAEIAAILPDARRGDAAALARSLVAMVHGHCVFALNGTFALLGETNPRGAALARAREILTAQG
jgi:AcrR family transcriptional regulator